MRRRSPPRWMTSRRSPDGWSIPSRSRPHPVTGKRRLARRGNAPRDDLANSTFRGVKISVAVSVLALCLLGAISENVATQAPLPRYAAALLDNQTWSFPSGHAMGALVGYGMLAYVLILLGGGSRKTNVLIVASTTALVVIIGISRLYLGVHYFSDVAGGYAAGLLWLCACIAVLERRLHPTD